MNFKKLVNIITESFITNKTAFFSELKDIYNDAKKDYIASGSMSRFSAS